MGHKQDVEEQIGTLRAPPGGSLEDWELQSEDSLFL